MIDISFSDVVVESRDIGPYYAEAVAVEALDRPAPTNFILVGRRFINVAEVASFVADDDEVTVFTKTGDVFGLFEADELADFVEAMRQARRAGAAALFHREREDK